MTLRIHSISRGFIGSERNGLAGQIRAGEYIGDCDCVYGQDGPVTLTGSSFKTDEGTIICGYDGTCTSYHNPTLIPVPPPGLRVTEDFGSLNRDRLSVGLKEDPALQ
jgi:hypothetical protein